MAFLHGLWVRQMDDQLQDVYRSAKDSECSGYDDHIEKYHIISHNAFPTFDRLFVVCFTRYLPCPWYRISSSGLYSYPPPRSSLILMVSFLTAEFGLLVDVSFFAAEVMPLAA